MTFYIFFKVCGAILGNRVSPETELAGLDIPEMGVLAYPAFTLKTGEYREDRREGGFRIAR